ncbi:MAG: hypothetical protein ACYSUQ_13950 [Planctomycetota bacterium]
MVTPTSAVDHLNAARESVHQERAGLSILGRALTPEEQARIEALSAAEADIDSAIGHLSSPVSPTIP